MVPHGAMAVIVSRNHIKEACQSLLHIQADRITDRLESGLKRIEQLVADQIKVVEELTKRVDHLQREVAQSRSKPAAQMSSPPSNKTRSLLQDPIGRQLTSSGGRSSGKSVTSEADRNTDRTPAKKRKETMAVGIAQHCYFRT